jgi:hypothetical protein
MASVMRFDQWEDSNGVPVASAANGVGKILQVVTATDSTQRTTASSSYADAGISVSITPKFASSVLYVTWIGRIRASDGGSGNVEFQLQITDSSDVALVGAEEFQEKGVEAGLGVTNDTMMTGTGVVNAVDTSARTYKLRFKRTAGGTCRIDNNLNTGRMIVMEVAA